MDGAGGGGGDVFSSAAAPLTWHDFLERMRHPSASDFVKSIKSFIVSFTNKAPNSDKDSDAVQEFLINMEGAFRAHSLWAGCSEEELESAGEGLEKYVMTKLFNRAFASLPEERKHDEELSEKIACIQQFIRPENLDIKPKFQNEQSWLLAQKELQKINMYKAPRDKLVCILNCCKVINNLLLNASLASSENPPGADEFLPVLIYVTIKANPPQLHSNLLYIQRYRCQSRLVSEAAYYFTNILSAESFIWNIDAQALSVDEIEFQKNMESARALLVGLSTDIEGQTGQNTHYVKSPSSSEFQDDRADRKKSKDSVSNQSTTMNYYQPQASDASKELDGKDPSTANEQSVSVLESTGASNLLKEEQLSKYFIEYPFLYASAGDLTVEDVEVLLDSYKQLVLKYVSLSKGIGIVNPSLPLPSTEKTADTEKSMEPDDQNSKEPGDVKEMETNSKKLDNCEALENSIGSAPEEVGSIAYNMPMVEPSTGLTSEKSENSS